MNKIYTKNDLLSMNSVIEKTNRYVTDNIEQFSDFCLERLPKLPELLNLSNAKQRKILNYVSGLDRPSIPEEFKIDHITGYMALMLLKQKNIDQLTKEQLYDFSLYLTEVPLEDYKRQAILLGNRKILDPLSSLTTDFFKERSILRYIETKSQSVVNWQDDNEQRLFQEETSEMLKSTDVDTLLSKTDYENELNEAIEGMNQIL